jgi:NADPH2:quinone reductase
MRVQAARLKVHGEPLEAEEIDLPEPSAGEVVVDMAFGGVNPVDRYAALGRVAPDGPLPRTLGSEGAGVAEGERGVVVRGYGLGSGRDGLWSSHAIVPAAALIDIPGGVSLDAAAAMGVAGVTAWRTVTELANVTPEDRVLVLGASGGVGSMIVSIVGHIGATVWGQTGAPAKESFVAARGADHVVVATADDLAPFAADLADLQPTVVFDALGGEFFGAAILAMAPRGRIVLFGTSADPTGSVPLQALYRKSLRVMGFGGLMESDTATAAGIAEALQAVADGRLEVCIDDVIPLAGVNTAFERLVDRSVRGKLVLDLQS